MKAVILAGGEGTRLRPLTSNQPKPMMPIANVPMMEHIVRLLARHGFDDIVVTVAFLANHIRNYFGDGSDFGVAHAVRDRGVAARHRRLGAQRDGRAQRDVPRHLRRRAHRRRPRARSSRRTASRQAFASIALKRVENPVEFGIVITRDDGTIERFLEKPTWGEVFSDTINTGIYVLEPERVRPHPRGRGRRLLGRRVPARSSTQGGKLYGHVARRLLGGRRHARGVPHRPRGHPRRPGRDRRSRASRSGTGSGSARTPTSRRTSWSRVRCSSATTAASSPGAVLRPYTVLGDDVVVKAEAQRRAQRRARPRLHRAVDARTRRGARPRAATSATACASRRASSSATSRSSAPTRSSTRR